MLLRPYRVLIRFIPLFAVLIAASQVTAQQKAPIPPASPKSEDRDTSASKPLATGESTQSPPAESAASNSSGPPWVELSDFAMRQEGLGSVFSVNYRLVEGTPEPGAQYVWIVAQPLGVVVRYIDEPVNLGRKQGSLEMRAASFVMGMGSVQTYVAKRLPSSRRIPFGNEEFEKISEVVTLGQASRPAQRLRLRRDASQPGSRGSLGPA